MAELLVHGENKASAKVGMEGLQVDVRALSPDSFGAAMQYFTGSKTTTWPSARALSAWA